MFRSVLLIFSGNATGSLMLLVRNLLVARLISVEDYGIAATFAISMAIVEMMSTLGLQKLIVQATDGNNPKLQAGLQGFHLMRSVVSSLVLFFLANDVARFLGIPDVAWAYQVLALVPLVNGLTHFDIYRQQRTMIYLPTILSTTGPALLSLLMIWPLYKIFGDYRVMLYAALVQGFSTVLISHLVANRRYALTLDRQVIFRSFGFGWPLLINNILLFAVFQGEKLVVGREMGMEILALFAMGFTLTLTPTLVLAGSVHSFFLPQLSATKDDPNRFVPLAMATLQSSLLNGLLLIAAIVLVGLPVVHFLLGDKYAALLPYLIWLALLQAMRTFKTGSAVVALSQARTSNAMIANAFRVISLIPSWYVAANGGELLTIIWIATGAELCGYMTSMALVKYRLGLSLRPMWLPLCSSMVLFAAATVQAMRVQAGQDALWGAIITAVLLLIAIATMKDLIHYIKKRTLSKYLE